MPDEVVVAFSPLDIGNFGSVVPVKDLWIPPIDEGASREGCPPQIPQVSNLQWIANRGVDRGERSQEGC